MARRPVISLAMVAGVLLVLGCPTTPTTPAASVKPKTSTKASVKPVASPTPKPKDQSDVATLPTPSPTATSTATATPTTSGTATPTPAATTTATPTPAATSTATPTPAATTTATPTPDATATAAQNVVKIQAGAFNPSPITVKVGDTVTWQNLESSKHKILPDNDGDFTPTGDINQNETGTVTFTKASTFSYHDAYRVGMSGIVIVTAN